MGGIIRGDTSKKQLALVFTGDEFNDGANFIQQSLKQEKVKASFFFTGNYYRNPAFAHSIQQLRKQGHYLGAHSDQHILYCDWTVRDKLLLSQPDFNADVLNNYKEMQKFGISQAEAPYFLPPYEWYNAKIVDWSQALGLKLINFSPGTRSNADYTYPEMDNRYVDNTQIWNSIVTLEQDQNLNGFILLLHIGTDPRRKEKFYHRLPALIQYLKAQQYQLVRVDELLKD